MFENLFHRGGLSLERLHSFHSFAQAGSIAKAAAGDVSRQALMSRQIRELEEFFGAELAVRRGKTLALSPAGRRLADLIHAQLHDLEDFQAEQNRQAKTITVGAGGSILEWLIIPRAAQIRELLGQPSLHFSVQRSRDQVAHIRYGRLDLAIVREDALPARALRLPLLRLHFHLCIPRQLLKGSLKSTVDDAALLKKLPLAATTGGGQLDNALREAMNSLHGRFQPAFECDSLLQVRELISQGACAGVLPHIGTHGLADRGVVIRKFAPLKTYGRSLVLHWNERQLNRRGIEEAVIKKVARVLAADGRPKSG